jgi:hypothetical protein
LGNFIQPIRNRSIPPLDLRLAPFDAKGKVSTLIAFFICLTRTRRRRCVDRAVQILPALDARPPAPVLRPNAACGTDPFISTS